ncbi:hypothetical protein J6590_075629 [Homalodisca vitripennis]|nr:hypothetical protein J6590_075629 [Homalodisca vitripennis]
MTGTPCLTLLKNGFCQTAYIEEAESLEILKRACVSSRVQTNKKPENQYTFCQQLVMPKTYGFKSHNEAVKPYMIQQYNLYMGGVDMKDKSIYHISCLRTTTRYWKKIFYNLLDMAIFDSILYLKKHRQAYAQKKICDSSN